VGLINPSLLAMLGRGFSADDYAVDGNHLRWQFDPRLGFPREAFCVEMRPSVLGDSPPRELMHSADLRLPAGSPPQTTGVIGLPEVEARRPGALMVRSVAGVALTRDPIVLTFRGTDAHACWVSLRFVLRSPGGTATARAQYLHAGQPEAVDRAIAPRVTAPVTVDLVISAARIDRVAVTGAVGDLERLSWIRTEDLMKDGAWKPVGCFPAATDEPDYRERNKPLFGNLDAAELAKQRVAEHGPVGVEPLDEPVVPPPRPAKDEEKFRRYLEPWLDRLEPWLARVLSESLGGGRHQSEVTLTVPLDDAGQRAGSGIPAGLASPSVSINPYEIVYAAGLTGFPTALLLGLGCVHRNAGQEILDYRVRSHWLVEDLWAWVQARERRLQELVDELAGASPHALAELQVAVLAAAQELAETTAFIQTLVAGADRVVELWGLVIGVQVAQRPLFAGPGAITVAPDGLGLPPDHADEAVAAIGWPLRQRARVIDDAAVPTGACIARTAAPGFAPLDDVRNPNDPADETSPPVAILPAGPAGAPGSAGDAVFADRYVRDGIDYRYGVSESDPFGRWSAFTETAFRWDDLTPPASPAEVRAQLAQEGIPALQLLTLEFSWPSDLADPAQLSFDVHLRRTPPPPAAPVDRPSWGHCERTSGTGAGPLTFAGDTDGDTTHDGMAVRIAFTDGTRSTPNGPRPYREYTVRLSGVVVPFDANDRAVAWAAVGTTNAKGIASADLGGPARAEDFLIAPPDPPVFPPEPRLAAYPDANRRSSVTLTWAAPAGRRSVVYRASERELVAMAQQRGLATTWREDDPSAQRSAAVRAVAPQLRDAFAPVSDVLAPGTATYTDELDGSLRTLSIYTIVGHSPALVPGPWPPTADGFVAVAVPKIPEPPVAVIVRGAPSTGALTGVELLIAEPASGVAVTAYEVLRTLESSVERAQDWRMMRPCGRFAVTAGSYVQRPGAGSPVMALLDEDAVLPWVAYLYRVVARGDAGGVHTRSRPSAVVRVVTLDALPPAPPAIVSADGSSAGTELSVSWTATAPDTPAGRWRFEVIDPEGPITLARVDASTVRDPADPGRFAVEVADRGTAAQVVVAVTDPTGRRAASAPAGIVLA
jgi:hypothetical protein